MSNSMGVTFSTRNIIIVACIALIIFLAAAAVVVAVMGNTGDMGERESIEAKLDELGDTDLGHKNVAAHLSEFGIGGFDAGKLRRVEYYFTNEYPMDIPTIPAMAHKTASLYLEYYYDKIDASDKESVTTALLRCFVESTGDAYAIYRTAEELADFDTDMSGTFVGIGISVTQTIDPATGMLEEVKVEDVINGSGAEDAGILAGDLIIAVDGRPLSEFDSNTLVNAIRGTEGTTVVITVLRAETEIDLSCERRLVIDKTVDYAISDGIAYIEITSFKSNTPDLFADALETVKAAGVKGIVFDLRGNPGGYLDSVLEVLDMLVPRGVTLASYVDASGDSTVFTSTGEGDSLDVPCVVICNERTASAGELFTAAMKDFTAMGLIRAKIVGTTTYGKGVMQNTYKLYDGSSITLTTAFYNPPLGTNYNGVGVVPDVAAADSEGSVDNQLAKALETLVDMVYGGGGDPSSGSDQNTEF